MAEAKPILMPKLGQTVEESTIVKWHKNVGDTIVKGDVMFEIETDKAVLDAEAFQEGTLLKILVEEGRSVPVQSVVAYVGAEGDTIPEVTEPPKPAPKKEAPTTEKKPTAPKPAAAPTASAAPEPQPTAPVTPGRLRISPRARKLAKDKVIDPSHIKGSGPEGRIVEDDVIAYLKHRDYDAVKISTAAKELAREEGLDLLDIQGTGDGGKIKIDDVRMALREQPRPMSKMRRIIADRLTRSFRDIPHFFVTVSVDMTDAMAFRKTLKEQGAPYSVTDFIMESVILSLKEHDTMNSMTPDGASIRWNSRVNLGLAVSVEQGLVVPVIRQAEELSLSELHDAAADLSARAREGKLKPDEMQGGTFTISNMGMLKVEQFNAIINPGESGILAVSSVAPTPVVKDGDIVVRQIMKMTLSADHRVVDGAEGAAFVNAVKDKLEDVELWKRLA